MVLFRKAQRILLLTLVSWAHGEVVELEAECSVSNCLFEMELGPLPQQVTYAGVALNVTGDFDEPFEDVDIEIAGTTYACGADVKCGVSNCWNGTSLDVTAVAQDQSAVVLSLLVSPRVGIPCGGPHIIAQASLTFTGPRLVLHEAETAVGLGGCDVKGDTLYLGGGRNGTLEFIPDVEATSVEFWLTTTCGDSVTYYQIDSTPPYVLFGDANGTYSAGGTLVPCDRSNLRIATTSTSDVKSEFNYTIVVKDLPQCDFGCECDETATPVPTLRPRIPTVEPTSAPTVSSNVAILLREVYTSNTFGCEVTDTIYLDNRTAGIEAIPTFPPENTSRVQFDLKNDACGLKFSRGEGAPPYSMYGDSTSGGVSYWVPAKKDEDVLTACDEGPYELTVTVTKNGEPDVEKSTFVFDVLDVPGCGFGCTCVNATDQPTVAPTSPGDISVWLREVGTINPTKDPVGCEIHNVIYLGNKNASIEGIPDFDPDDADRVEFHLVNDACGYDFKRGEGATPFMFASQCLLSFFR